MKKIMFISPFLNDKQYGGSILSNNYFSLMRNIDNSLIYSISFNRNIDKKYSNAFQHFTLPSLKSKIGIAFNNFYLNPLNIDSTSIQNVKKILLEIRPSYIYLDSSTLGIIAKWIKFNLINSTIIVFFHNVERDFELQRLLRDIRYFPSFISTCYNEKLSCKYADKIVALHKTDAKRLKHLYKRDVDLLLPVLTNNPSFKKKGFVKNPTFGFLGSAFYANIEAAEYISKLATKLPNINFVIAGRGFDKYLYKFKNNNNIRITGELNTVDDFYHDVDVFLAPIFSGAGMKVKIAEALSFNIPIIASDFALIGYEKIINSKHVHIAYNFDNFIKYIQYYKSGFDFLNIHNDELYKKNFSKESMLNEIGGLFDDSKNITGK